MLKIITVSSIAGGGGGSSSSGGGGERLHTEIKLLCSQ
jgi:hypothetical protein